MKMGFSIRRWLYREFFLKDLQSPFGIIFLILVAVGTSYLVVSGNFLVIGGLIAALVGSMMLYVVIFRPIIGYYLVTLLGCFAFYPTHILHVNLGLATLVELLFWVLLLGTFRERPIRKDRLLGSPITVMFIIYTLYHFIQVFNPELRVWSMYYFVMRKFFMFICIYVISYRLINTPERVRCFIRFWIFIGFLAGAYACFQQWFGYLPRELQYIASDPTKYKLMFQGGQLRKLSFLSDVAQAGVFMGSLAVFSLIVAIHEKERKRKIFLFVAFLLMTLGMSYSGTRTATFILPTGMSMYVIMLIRNKTTLITLFCSLMVGLFIMFAPIYSNKTLNRLRTSFETSDPSLNVRDVNRHYIQPYLRSHPFGGGVGMTGPSGRETDPNHVLAGFPPDSGLLEIGLEVGWIGLTLTVIWYLIILYYYIYTAFRIRNPEFKIYTIALLCCILSIIVTQYSQISIGQIPLVIFYMASISIVMRLLEFQKLDLYDKK